MIGVCRFAIGVAWNLISIQSMIDGPLSPRKSLFLTLSFFPPPRLSIGVNASPIHHYQTFRARASFRLFLRRVARDGTSKLVCF